VLKEDSTQEVFDHLAMAQQDSIHLDQFLLAVVSVPEEQVIEDSTILPARDFV